MLEEDRILKINIENEMKSAYIDYSSQQPEQDRK